MHSGGVEAAYLEIADGVPCLMVIIFKLLRLVLRFLQLLLEDFQFPLAILILHRSLSLVRALLELLHIDAPLQGFDLVAELVDILEHIEVLSKHKRDSGRRISTFSSFFLKISTSCLQDLTCVVA